MHYSPYSQGMGIIYWYVILTHQLVYSRWCPYKNWSKKSGLQIMSRLFSSQDSISHSKVYAWPTVSFEYKQNRENQRRNAKGEIFPNINCICFQARFIFYISGLQGTNPKWDRLFLDWHVLILFIRKYIHWIKWNRV